VRMERFCSRQHEGGVLCGLAAWITRVIRRDQYKRGKKGGRPVEIRIAGHFGKSRLFKSAVGCTEQSPPRG
jgi:hypothetical protein